MAESMRQESGSARPRASRAGKSAAAFRTISEVAGELDVAQHVLRFWESKFPQVRPLKRGGGRRYYRPEDVDLLRQIRSLLYDEGYTIKGAQKLLKTQKRAGGESDGDEGEAAVASAGMAAESVAPDDPVVMEADERERLVHIRGELVAMRDELRRLLG
jgi:DNA-binding transcriptional MerR regulator